MATEVAQSLRDAGAADTVAYGKEACERHISRGAEDVEFALVRHADELAEQGKEVGIGVRVWIRFLPALILYPIWLRTMVALDLWEPAYRDGAKFWKVTFIVT